MAYESIPTPILLVQVTIDISKAIGTEVLYLPTKHYVNKDFVSQYH